MENDQLHSASQPNAGDLQASYDSLHQLVISMLLVLVVVTGTVWVFFWKQARTTGGDLTTFRQQVTQMKATEPLMEDVARKLQEFGRTNPDFVPYLAKYGIQPGVAIPAVPADRAAAPAPAPGKKK